MLRLRRLKINKFRAVKPGTELRFHNGHNVLLGKNATGKTTLLELIAMAVRLDFRDIQAEDFDVEFDIAWEADATTIAMQVQVGTRPSASSPEGALLGYAERTPWVKITTTKGINTCYLEMEGTTLRIFVNAEQASAELFSRGLKLTFIAWRAAILLNVLEHESAAQTVPLVRIRETWHVLRYDEALDVFRKIFQRTDILAEVSWVSQKDTKIGQDDRRIFNYIVSFAPTSLVDQVQERVDNDSKSNTLEFSHEDLPFLNEFNRLCGFSSATLKLSLLGRDTESDGTVVAKFGEPKFWFTRKDGQTTIRHEVLSFGQKRLLALLYYLETNPHHLVADELVNGLHHEWIEEVMTRIGERQTFLSSQNPLLLDYMEFDTADDVQSSFVLCELDESECMAWRNMSLEEAGSFYSAYEVGIQHVGEILRTKGLW